MDTVNGVYVGERVGTPLGDALSPDGDGYEAVRSIQHVGTQLGDASTEEGHSVGKAVVGKAKI